MKSCEIARLRHSLDGSTPFIDMNPAYIRHWENAGWVRRGEDGIERRLVDMRIEKDQAEYLHTNM